MMASREVHDEKIYWDVRQENEYLFMISYSVPPRGNGKILLKVITRNVYSEKLNILWQDMFNLG